MARDKAIADCRSALFLTDPDVDRETLITAKGRRVPGTCEWIREDPNYQQWLDGTRQLLWICGSPGKGKTMLSVFLVEELKQKQSVMSYFCTSGDANRNNATAVLRSLLWQITKIHLDLAQHFLTHLGAGESDAARRIEASLSSVEALWMTFTTICRDPKVSEIAFILDGLDECDQESRDWLASKFYSLDAESDIQNTHPPKIIVVSRYIPRLRLCNKLRLDPDYNGKIGEDVQRFVSARVQDLWDLGGFDEAPRRHVESTLLERSEGSFLWVGFAIAELLRKQTVLEVEHCLKDLPAGLPAFYGRMLRHIAMRDADKIAKILQWTTLSVRPLSLFELAAAISCESTKLCSAEEVTRDLVTLCQPFLTIQPKAGPREKNLAKQVSVQMERESTNEEQTVNLIHQSARDFMDSSEVPAVFQFEREKAHIEMAWRCMDLIQGGADAKKLSPMLEYAIEHWAAHARQESTLAESLLEHPSGFFDESSRVRNWWWRQKADRIGYFGFPFDCGMLHLSAYTGFVPWIKRDLVRKWWWKPGVDYVNMFDVRLESPLSYATKQGHGAATQVLLEHGATASLIWNLGSRLPAIHSFAASGNEMAVQACLDHGTKLDAAGEQQQTLLHLAATGGHDGMVELLLSAGADCDAKDANQRTALMLAAHHGQDGVVQLLLRSGAYCDARDADQYTALMLAAHHGHDAVVRSLLDHGAEIESKDRNLATAWRLAAEKGHEKVTKMLLDRGALADSATTLCIAAGQGNEVEVRLQLDGGVPVDAKNLEGITALYCAALEGHDAVVQVLIDWGARLDAIADASDLAGGRKIMHVVAWKFGHDERIGQIVKMCCDLGADINAVDDQGWTPLHFAATRIRQYMLPVPLERGDPRLGRPLPVLVARALLDHGAKVDAADNCGLTPLLWATNEDNNVWRKIDRPVVQLLLDRGAHADARDSLGRTPLHMLAGMAWAVMEDLTLLLDHGAKVDSQDQDGSTVLHVAIRSNLRHLVSFLLDRGAQFAVRDSHGRTALHLAAGDSRTGKSILVSLLDRGAEINARDNEGRTPLNYAYELCNSVSVQLLESHGAIEGHRIGLVERLKYSRQLAM